MTWTTFSSVGKLVIAFLENKRVRASGPNLNPMYDACNTIVQICNER